MSLGPLPHYIILFNFTDQGIRNVKDTVKRAENYKVPVEDAGGRVINEYYTFGKHDIVTIVESPNDVAIMSVLLSTSEAWKCT